MLNSAAYSKPVEVAMRRTLLFEYSGLPTRIAVAISRTDGT
jgi:hypothetical protein